MATTLKNTASGAKSNIFSNAAKRYIGFITAFVGAMILFLGTNITATVIQIVAITLLLIGILLFSGNVKKIFKKLYEQGDIYKSEYSGKESHCSAARIPLADPVFDRKKSAVLITPWRFSETVPSTFLSASKKFFGSFK